jgi:serine/threonine protein kinase
VVKVIRLSNTTKVSKINDTLKALISLIHENVAKIYDIVIGTNQMLYIVMEYSTITLQEFIKKCLESARNINETRVRSYIKQLMTGLKHIHDNGVIHGNINTNNVIMFSLKTSKSILIGDPLLKCIGFGCATLSERLLEAILNGL